jgi:hypothetical protein
MHEPLSWLQVDGPDLQAPGTSSALLIGLVLLTAGMAPAQAAGGPVKRIALLPLVDRATVAIELSAPVAEVRQIQGDPTAVVVEVGPLTAPVEGEELTSAAPSIVQTVRTRAATRSDGPYLRVEVALRSGSAYRHRVSGTRLYLDFGPPVVTAAARRPDSTPTAQTPAHAAPPPLDPPKAQPPKDSSSKAGDATAVKADDAPAAKADISKAAAVKAVGSDPGRTTYEALESETLRRARSMAAVPDVKGLLRLRQEVERRDAQLGKKQPQVMDRLIAELTRLTDEARAVQLERDRHEFANER